MTQIFFYHNAGDRIGAAAALIGKAFMQRKALLVFAPDHEVAGALDRHLWIHPPTGFIPHVRGNSPLANETPVVIADDIESPPQNERLINLSADIPPGFSPSPVSLKSLAEMTKDDWPDADASSSTRTEATKSAISTSRRKTDG